MGYISAHSQNMFRFLETQCENAFTENAMALWAKDFTRVNNILVPHCLNARTYIFGQQSMPGVAVSTHR